MTLLRTYFSSGAWQRLRPAQDLLAEQPGAGDARHFIAAARTESGDWTVVYLPVGGPVRLHADVATGRSARWFDPRNGHWTNADTAAGDDRQHVFTTPSADDWVLDLRR